MNPAGIVATITRRPGDDQKRFEASESRLLMRAMVIDGYGGADCLRLAEMERPTPRAGEMLVRVRAAGINPIDWKTRQGHLRVILHPRFPYVPGLDVAGDVIQVGEGVTEVQPGMRVFGQLHPRLGGGYAEYAVLPVVQAAEIPRAVSYVQAASLPVAGLTALQSLRDLGHVGPGKRVLVNGGAGGVGHLAVQLTRILGAEVAATCGPANLDFVRNLGAQLVIDYQSEDFTHRDETYDVVFDAAATRSFLACHHSIRDFGFYITTLPRVSAFFWIAIHPLRVLLGHDKQVKFIIVKPSGKDLAVLGRLVAEGTLIPHIARTFPLEEVAAAHLLSETGHSRGKLVLEVA